MQLSNIRSMRPYEISVDETEETLSVVVSQYTGTYYSATYSYVTGDLLHQHEYVTSASYDKLYASVDDYLKVYHPLVHEHVSKFSHSNLSGYTSGSGPSDPGTIYSPYVEGLAVRSSEMYTVSNSSGSTNANTLGSTTTGTVYMDTESVNPSEPDPPFGVYYAMRYIYDNPPPSTEMYIENVTLHNN